MSILYKLLDNSIYIIAVAYLLYYIIKYYTKKTGSIDTDQTNQDLFMVSWYRKYGKNAFRR